MTSISRVCPSCGKSMVAVWTGDPPVLPGILHPREWVHHETGMVECLPPIQETPKEGKA